MTVMPTRLDDAERLRRLQDILDRLGRIRTDADARFAALRRRMKTIVEDAAKRRDERLAEEIRRRIDQGT